MSASHVRYLKAFKIWCFILGLLLLFMGGFFTIGGFKLVGLGGSWYFIITGIITLISAFFIFIKKSLGVWLFALVFIGTLIWAFIDAGMDFWALFSRLMVPAGLFSLLMFTLPSIRRYQNLGQKNASNQTHSGMPAYIIGIIVVVGALFGLYSMFQPHPTIVADGNELPLITVDTDDQQVNWAHYGNDAGGNRFVALDQINRDNVSKLKEAWRFETGDFSTGTGGGAEDQLTPLQIDDTVFLCTPHNNVFAINADTGKQIWKKEVNSTSEGWERCRGLGYFDSTQPLTQPTRPDSTPVTSVATDTVCQRRVYTNTPDGRLIAINADNGELCTDFGDNGTVDLHVGMGDGLKAPRFEVTSSPTVAGTTLVIGSRIADNFAADMPGGVIRGYDVITGELRWAFDSRNPDPNYVLKPGEIYKRSSANSWAAMSYDPEMNTVFIPMGGPSVDVWGANRVPEDHKYGSSVLAVDATTGQEKWVYQTVHNDLWDFDLPMQPSLIDFPIEDGTTIPAVLIGTKSGQFFVLDRYTGEPLTEVIEQPVKAADIPNEQYSLTQPRSVGMPQIGNQTLTESDMWGATPFDQLLCRINFKSMRYNGLFTAPGTDISLSFPGSLGGMNWGGMSFDPLHNYLFVNDMRLGLWIQLIAQEPAESGQEGSGTESVNTGMGAVPMNGTPYKVNKDRFMSPLGIPCQKPPYGTLTAIDLKKRRIAWQIPLGTVQDTGPLGIKTHLQAPIGMPTIGGSMTTQGGLVFFAATQDYYLRAFDTSNGRELWKQRLPVGSQGTPISYVSPKTGKQYIVLSVGGARQSPDHGDYVIAYSLDDEK